MITKKSYTIIALHFDEITKMSKYFFAFVLSSLCLTSCASFTKNDVRENVKTTEKQNISSVKQNSNSADEISTGANSIKTDEFINAVPVTKTDCLSVDAGDNEILAKQTFPIDFAPFPNSCFVTAYNPEFDDPPMESEFAIYKDNKKVFDFPSRFNGVEFGCWVAGVAFEDLNGDNLKDIIVAGKCSAKSAPYNENMIYVNTGKTCTTDETANYKLADFDKIKDIISFAKNNRNIFFK